jgi:hypothetical protein
MQRGSFVCSLVQPSQSCFGSDSHMAAVTQSAKVRPRHRQVRTAGVRLDVVDFGGTVGTECTAGLLGQHLQPEPTIGATRGVLHEASGSAGPRDQWVGRTRAELVAARYSAG